MNGFVVGRGVLYQAQVATEVLDVFLMFGSGCSGRRPVNRPAIQDRLQQTVVEVVGVRVNRVRTLARVAEPGANQRIQEIGARHEFGENAKSDGIVFLQFGDSLRWRVGARITERGLRCGRELARSRRTCFFS